MAVNTAVTESRKQGIFYGWVIAVLGFVILGGMWGLVYSFGVFFKPVSEEFGCLRAMTSGAFSLFSVLHGALYIITGKLNDRFGPRILVTVCGLFLGVGFLLMRWIDSPWQLYLFYGVLMGIGLSGGTIPIVSTIARWFVKSRGLATGITVSGIGLGTLAVPPLASSLIAAQGWRFSFLAVGIASTVVLVVIAQFLKREPSQVGCLPYGVSASNSKDAADWKPTGHTLKEALHTKQFWMVCGIFFCYAGLSNPIMVHIVPHATDIGISPDVAAGILATLGGVSIAGRLVMGPVADRMGKRPAVILLTAVTVAAFIWLIFAGQVWSLYLFAVVFGFAWGGGNVVSSPLTAELFGLKAIGAIYGVVGAVSTLDGAFIPLLAGYVYDTTGHYTIAFVIFAGLAATSLVLALLLKSSPMKPIAQAEAIQEAG